jgi:hypothetical protein
MSLNENVLIEENEEVSQVTQENQIENTLDIDTSVDKYKKIINIYSNVNTEEVNISTIDQILEKEKQHNKSEQWTKLDKTVKMQKLHQFAEKYGKEYSLSVKDVKQLKTFFTECLGKNKLNKTKDVIYDKEKRDINSIPSLHFNIATKNYTLKIMDAKRVSTLKSLTPKKIV